MGAPPKTLPANFDFGQKPPDTLPADFFDSQNALEAQRNTSSEQIAKDLGVGFVKGMGQAANEVSQTLNKVPYVGEYLAPSEGIKAAGQLETPANTAQRVGAAGGNLAGNAALVEAGGQLVPGAWLDRLHPLAQAAIRATMQGATGAALSPNHPLEGAAIGARAEGVAQAAKALAPEFVNSALGIGERSKRFGRNPAQAVLDETKGVTPGTVAKNIQARVNELSGQLDTIAKAHPDVKVDLSPALNKLLDIADELHAQNYHDADPILDKLWNSLTVDGKGGEISTQVSPEQALNLKRGLQRRVSNWTPGAGSEEAVIAKQLQHILGNSISEALPETAHVNAKLANLIEAGRRAGVVERSAGATQRLLHRATVPTGALMSADIGEHIAGIPGAAGAVVAQEALRSPTVRMAIARGLNAAPEISRPVAIPLWSLYQSQNEQEGK